MHTVTAKEVADALRKCVDPELDANIVDVGLIYGIDVDASNNVKIKLTMTTPMCPVTSIILADAEIRLKEIPDIGNVDIELVWDPLWSPDMVSDEIKSRFQ